MSVKTNLIQKSLLSHRAHVDEAVKDLHELAIRIGNEDLSKTVSDLRNRIHDPFMFVIVGEVKAGKSSFINALLEAEREVTKVAPQPMTDTIQQIVYGPEYEEISINPFLKKITVPVDILKEIAIVDTPGTNTIIDNHQHITEQFIPASDLIVFVFEAKNPYRQSSWDFFNYIRDEWRKKVVFVLQQKDLMNEEDLKVNQKGVYEYAEKKGIREPIVFSVSAKQEQEGDKVESGFLSVRNYIKENITGGRAPVMKLQNSVDTSVRILQNISDGLNTRDRQWEADQAFREDIRETLDHQENQSKKQVDILVENILAGYDRITGKKEEELRSGLGFFALVRRSFSSIFSKKASAQQWLEDLAKELETELDAEIKNKLNDGIDDLADSVQQMAKLIDLKIRNSKTILNEDHEIFSDIAERRHNIIRDLRETFDDFIRKSESFTDSGLFPDNRSLASNIATGSGLAVVGIILAAVVQGSVFDITGGVLTTLGLLFAGIGTSGKRRKVVRRFREEIGEGRERIETEVSGQLKSYITRLKGKIDTNFFRFDQMLIKEREQIDELRSEHAKVNQVFVDLKTTLNNFINTSDQSTDGQEE
jgi:ribosome biogenesis GTPase A